MAELEDGPADPNQDHWQLLSTHLRNVADLGNGFAEHFSIALRPQHFRFVLAQ